MKTLIAVPCMDTLATPFVRAKEDLKKVGLTTTAYMESSLVYDSRNKLAELAVSQKTDFVLWLDSDMVFNENLLVDLMADIETGKEIVCGLFFARREPYHPAIWKTMQVGLPGDSVNERYLEYPRDQIFEIQGCGAAAVLMKTEVLEAMIKEFGTCFQPINGYGEDLSFCIRARRLGYKLWCDSRVKVGHISKQIINEPTYDAWKKNEVTNGADR